MPISTGEPLTALAMALGVLGVAVLIVHDPQHPGPPLWRFGLAALTGGLSVAASWPGNPASVLAVGGLLWAAGMVFAIQFLWAFIDRPTPPWQRGLWLQALVMPLLPLLAPGQVGAGAGRLLAAALSMQLLWGLVQATLACWPTRPADARALVLSLLSIPATWLLVRAWPEGGGHFMPLPPEADGVGWTVWRAVSAPAAWMAPLLPIGLHLLVRLRQQLRLTQLTLGKVQAQFDKASSEFNANAAQLSEMRVQQVTEQERKRIAADLHDDLGAKLLTIVHTCENERIAALGREALDEMRLSVRGLSGRPMPLGDAMADWRAETVQRLGQSNIQVEWQALGDDVQHLLPARAYVQTTRILREAVSNIIKHSGASRCEVRCFVTEQHYGVVVEDNGRGMAAATEGALGRGHGLSSMKHRAKQLQGQCLVESGIGRGTVIRLSLPF